MPAVRPLRPAHRHDRNSILGQWAGSHIRTRDRTGAANGHVTEPMPIFQIWEPRAGDAPTKTPGTRRCQTSCARHVGTLCPFASAPQRPAQASALSAPAGARGAAARAPDETRRGGTRDGRVEAGSITFLIRFSIIIFSILKSIFMRTLNRRARRAAVRGAEWRLPPATDIRVSPRSPRPRIFTSRHEGCPPRRACATSFAGGVVAR